MPSAEVTVDVERPPEDVFAFVSDFENNPRWQSGVREATVTTEGPLAAGSEYTQVAGFLGRRIESTFRVTDYEAGRLVRIESIAGTFPIQVTRRVEPTAAGSRVTATIEGQPGGLFGVLSPIVGRLMRRRIASDYERLKALLEEGAAESR